MAEFFEHTVMKHCMNGELYEAKFMYSRMSSIRKEMLNTYTVISMLSQTCMNGHLDVVAWIYDTFPVRLLANAEYTFSITLKNNHFPVCEFLLDVYPHLLSCDILKNVFILLLTKGNLLGLKWLLNIRPELGLDKVVITSKQFSTACFLGHLDIAKWIFELKPTIRICMINHLIFKGVMASKQMEVGHWLQSLKPEYYKINYDENGVYKDYIIRSKADANWYKVKYAVWLASDHTPNSSSILYKIPQDISKYVVEMLL